MEQSLPLRADPESRFIELDGVPVHYRRYGSGRRTFVLLHGTLSSTYTWRRVVGRLAEWGTVIAYDRPAFGLTSGPQAGARCGSRLYGYEAQADWVARLMDAWGVERAVLMGNSMGGAIAALAALHHPDRAEALVLVDPAVVGHGFPAWQGALLGTPPLRWLGPRFLRCVVRRFGRTLYRNSWHDPARIRPEDVAKYEQLWSLKDWDRRLWELIVAARPFESLVRYEALRVPALVVSGDDDRVVGTAALVALAERIPGAQLAVLLECGHVPQEECPEALLAAVAAFLI